MRQRPKKAILLFPKPRDRIVQGEKLTTSFSDMVHMDKVDLLGLALEKIRLDGLVVRSLALGSFQFRGHRGCLILDPERESCLVEVLDRLLK